MKKQRVSRFVMSACLLAILSVSTTFVYARAVIAKYEGAAPCGKLSGFDGLLQKAHFIPASGCIVNVAKGGCGDNGVCTISNPPSGKSTKGHCTPTADKKNCVCGAD